MLKIENRVTVRLMNRPDLGEVSAIDRASFLSDPWESEDFLVMMRRQEGITRVVELTHLHVSPGPVVGYMVAEQHKRHIRLVRLAAHPYYLRHGIGSQMVRAMLTRTRNGRVTRVVADVPETRLGMQLMLRELGFIAEQTVRGESGAEDAYVMAYTAGRAER